MPMDSDNFFGFSIGSRSCIGRKFATTEAVAFLTMLLRDWRVEPLLKAGETVEAWQKRTLDAKILLTLGVKDVSIRFTRRIKGTK
jgi:cytochrome P450